MKNSTPVYRFRKQDHIGSASAEDDTFLEHCFVDTGDYDELIDCKNPRRIIVGRTGTGKSALIAHLKTNQARTREISPELLSMSYITNSTILRFLSENGVKLDTFFRYLWRHVLALEILKLHYGIDSDKSRATSLQKIKSLASEKARRAYRYIEQWDHRFWLETDYTVKEITDQLVRDVEAEVGTTGESGKGKFGAVSRMSHEEKTEVKQRAQQIANSVHIIELGHIIEFIDEVLDDPQKPYFIVIDRLDDQWIDDALRYRMIRALVETVKDFKKVHHAKVIIGLRLDLLRHVFDVTRDVGFQEEKYEALYLRLKWDKSQLQTALDRRVDRLLQHAYHGGCVKHSDVLPKNIHGQNVFDYIIERTMMRPRDVIQFFNECIAHAAGETVITRDMLLAAEGLYSEAKLIALKDEWATEFPCLALGLPVIDSTPATFELGNLSDDLVSTSCLQIAERKDSCHDLVTRAAARVVDDNAPIWEFTKALTTMLYVVGAIGVKVRPNEGIQWADAINKGRTRTLDNVTCETKASIHPAFWRTLNTRLADQ